MAAYRISEDQSGGVGLAYNELRRVHWSKEASSYFTPYSLSWSTAGLKVIVYYKIRALVEAIVRRWCCLICGNNFVSPRQIVTAIRQHCSLNGPTVLSITTITPSLITEIAVDVVS